jgi:hypothetical protein
LDKQIAIENIEWMRRSAGINDVELWAAIRALRSGDFVRLTFVGASGSHATETLRVRITRIRGSDFRGKLADPPSLGGLPGLDSGSTVTFTSSHIHSVAAKPRSTHPVSQMPPVQVLISH